MKTFRKSVVIISLFCIFIFLGYLGCSDEMYYYKHATYKNYTIEINMINNITKQIVVRQPVNTHFQILCDRGNYYLAGILGKGELLLGGHWQTIKEGVVDFKILK
jgi:hypothetical protein